MGIRKHKISNAKIDVLNHLIVLLLIQMCESSVGSGGSRFLTPGGPNIKALKKIRRK